MALISVERFIPQGIVPDALKKLNPEPLIESESVEVFVASKGKTHIMDIDRYLEVSARMEQLIKSSKARKEPQPLINTQERKPSRGKLMAAAITLFTSVK